MNAVPLLLLLLLAPPHQSLPSLVLVDRLPNSPEVFFGGVFDVDAWSDGGTVVLDGVSQEIMIFDEKGSLLKVLGRKGQGPGEFLGAAELEIGPSEQIGVTDARNQRITIFDQQGRLLRTFAFSRFMPPGSGWIAEFSWTPGGAFLKTTPFLPDRPARILRLPPDLEGPGEVMVEFRPGLEGAHSCTLCPTLVGGTGRVLAAAGDTLYRIEELDSLGRVRKSWGRSDLPAVLRPEEELERIREAARRRAAAEGPVVGPVLSPYQARLGRGSLALDSAGRLWTLPSQPDEKGTMLDVFGPDGAMLGSVRVDEELKEIRIRRGMLLGIGETELGEPVVFRYRLEG